MVASVAGRLVLTSSAVLAIEDGVRRKTKRWQQDGAGRRHAAQAVGRCFTADDDTNEKRC